MVEAHLVQQGSHAGDAAGDVGPVVAPGDPAGAEACEAPGGPRVNGAADPDRHAVAGYRLGHGVHAIEREAVSGVRGLRLGPEGRADLQGLVQEPSAYAELEARRRVLGCLPADAHPEVQATSGQYVEGGRSLGQHDRSS